MTQELQLAFQPLTNLNVHTSIHFLLDIKTFYFPHCINVLYSSLPLNQDDDVPFMYP